jgi:hypothetical protein
MNTTKTLNLFNLINRFKQENEIEPFAPSVAALYFHLLCLANSRHWQMPLRYPTARLCLDVSLSKQALVNARDELKSRGLIDFTPGYCKKEAPTYTILDKADDLTNELTNNLTNELTNNLTNELTNELTNTDSSANQLTNNLTNELTKQLTNDLTIYKIKDKEQNKDKDIFILNKKPVNQIFDLIDLELKLSANKEWQDSVVQAISNTYPGLKSNELKNYLRNFFLEQRLKGKETSTEPDCKNYFFNWLKIQLKNSYKNAQYDRRCGADVTATSPDDYEGAF